MRQMLYLRWTEIVSVNNFSMCKHLTRNNLSIKLWDGQSDSLHLYH